MSSFNAIGFFALAAGQRLSTQRPGAEFAIHHCHYQTSLKSSNGHNIAAKLRIYSSTVLPDDTVAFVVAKVSVPTGQLVELDAFIVVPFPGDPRSPDYEDAIPEIPVFLYGVGHIPANHSHQILTDEHNGAKAFTVVLSDYVDGRLQGSTVQCVMPATARWANTPIPRAQSCTQFLGICNGTSSSGLLRVVVEHITLSIAPQPQSSSSSTTVAPPGSPATPTKRKKYTAYTSPASVSAMPNTSVSAMPNTSISAMPNPFSTQSISTSSQAGPSNFRSFDTRPITSFQQPAPGMLTTSPGSSNTRKRTVSDASSLSSPAGDDEQEADKSPKKRKGKQKKVKN
ncbi:hypothetical protein B0H10DRAFT_2000340 [Mycena sp. CBHHK59/15]|nr:hypothetical protein B0H10DRAFT_2000340 [Mycena sp. CBHHK59/15]